MNLPSETVSAKQELERYIKSQLQNAALFQALAKLEQDDQTARVLTEISEESAKNARSLGKRLWGGEQTQLSTMGFIGTLLLVFARFFGVARIYGFLTTFQKNRINRGAEFSHVARQELGKNREIISRLRALADGRPPKEEDKHYHLLSGFLAGEGGNLRAAILGLNDGLVSNVSLVMGVAGGVGEASTVILAGVAGLVAGAFSMAAGEYISVRSQRDVYESLIKEERLELELWPDEGKNLLAKLLEKKGLEKAQAIEVTEHVVQTPQSMLDTMLKEELGIDAADLGSPWGAAISSTIAFSIGAFVPIFPFLISSSGSGYVLLASALASAAALLLVGAGLSYITAINPVHGATRMLGIGTIAAAVTFGIGSLVGSVIL